jgi:hypothetical protein
MKFSLLVDQLVISSGIHQIFSLARAIFSTENMVFSFMSDRKNTAMFSIKAYDGFAINED